MRLEWFPPERRTSWIHKNHDILLGNQVYLISLFRFYPKYRINTLLDSVFMNMKISDSRISYYIRPNGLMSLSLIRYLSYSWSLSPTQTWVRSPRLRSRSEAEALIKSRSRSFDFFKTRSWSRSPGSSQLLLINTHFYPWLPFICCNSGKIFRQMWFDNEKCWVFQVLRQQNRS